MKLLHWTLFVDLLGYRDINGDVNNLEKAEELIDFMKSNVEVFDKQNNNPELKEYYAKSSFDLYKHYDISFAFISDSLIVSYTPNLELDFDEKVALSHSSNMLLILLQRLRAFIYKCVLEKQIFLRGGISNHFSYIGGAFAVGKGVGSAYVAENQAKYPRVILAEDVVQNTELMKAIEWLSQLMYKADLIVNDNGTRYLDFNKFGIASLDARSENKFVIQNACSNPSKYKETIQMEGGYLKVTKEAIEFQIKKALTLKGSPDKNKLYESLKDKYIWLSEYHNRSCIDFSDLKIAIPGREIMKNPATFQIFQELSRMIPMIKNFCIDEALLQQLKVD
ncbi:hypothetical protein [Acinetobacter variabilis]|uniref:hypothetical protein n=1 Tax=Acinetobacter variabilis TaxID=70346 RepID=UPI0028976BD3|nr:hypothetical protein [Acinetobacter variabilis]